jgi:hypothetical protein
MQYFGGTAQNEFHALRVVDQDFLILRGFTYDHKGESVVVVSIQRLRNNKTNVLIVPSKFLKANATARSLKKHMRAVPQHELGNWISTAKNMRKKLDDLTGTT